jgi:hypothetical protein
MKRLAIALITFGSVLGLLCIADIVVLIWFVSTNTELGEKLNNTLLLMSLLGMAAIFGGCLLYSYWKDEHDTDS